MADDALKHEIEAEIARLAPGWPIRVSLRGGVVSLEGSVSDASIARRLEQELLRRRDIADVHSWLKIAPRSRDLRSELIAALSRERLDIRGLRVEADDGAVTLRGEALSWFDRDAAERQAWGLPDVRAVRNELTLAAGASDAPTGLDQAWID